MDANKLTDNTLKYVVGEAAADKPAFMRFYGRIDEYSCQAFNEEFLWLQDYVKPSKIIVSINSEGGSVLYGMGTFSLLQNSTIEVETIIEGLAASMGSVLWAAGKRSYMRDYSLLMIHNPFAKSGDQDDPDTKQTIAAFKKQIETVYHKRFGLSKERVREIMDGAEGCDGTFFDAKQAVEAGIIPADHVLKTSKQVRDKVKNQIEGLTEADKIQQMMSSINMDLEIDTLNQMSASLMNDTEGIKPTVDATPIPNQKQQEKPKSTEKMEKDEDRIVLSSVCSQLGLSKDSEMADVVNALNSLKEAKTQLAETQDSLDKMKIEKEGLTTQLNNANDELKTVKAELQTYKDAEKAQRNAEISQFIDNAIADGKINAEAKEKWVEMAQNNFETVQETLNSIPARDKISAKIADDPANVEAAKTGLTEAEAEVQAKVEEVVGKEFAFKTMD